MPNTFYMYMQESILMSIDDFIDKLESREGRDVPSSEPVIYSVGLE